MSTEQLGFHVLQEDDNDDEYSDVDLIAMLRSNREDVREYMSCLKDDIRAVGALEDFAGSITNKAALTTFDIQRYNEIVEAKQYNTTGMTYSQVSLESFDSLVNTVSKVSQTAGNVANKAMSAAILVKEGVVAGAEMAKILYEKVQSSIVKIAASWDFVCSMIEKRWLGLAQLVKVYELQHSKLREKFDLIAMNKGATAFFNVKLYVAKLRSDGRDLRNKETLLNAFILDSAGIAELGTSFIQQMEIIKRTDAYSAQALTLRFPYKKALTVNANAVNSMLKELSMNALFYEGGFTKPYQAQSRVLLGGKVIHINYNEHDAEETTVRRDIKQFIGNLSFNSVKRRDGTSNDTENIEISAMSLQEANTLFTSVEITNEALKSYQESNVPAMLKARKSVSSLIGFASGLTGGDVAFDTIKRFFSRDDNLKAFNLVAPVAVTKILGTFLAASSFAVFSGIVAISAATFLIDYLRKYIISGLFSMMDLQYKVTDVIEKFDHDYVDTLIEIHNQGYRICKKLASTRSWEY